MNDPISADVEMERRLGALEAENTRLREALEAIQPHLGAIICYASTADEHEPNRIAQAVNAALNPSKDSTS